MLIQRHAVESTLTGADWVFVYLKGSVKQQMLYSLVYFVGRADSGQSPLSRRMGYLIGDITLICLFHYASNSKL